jgi:AcrR family transcriptional regulator
MARPRKYDDSEILEAAAAEFLEKGAAASTVEIAQRAGVSEGILFQRFKTKEALFAAALTTDFGAENWRATLLESVGKNTPAENLKRALLALHAKLERIVPRLMILEGQGQRRPRLPGRKPPPQEDAETIASYLQKEIKLGRLSLDQPKLHAHEMIGSVLHCTMMSLRHHKTVCSPEELADHLLSVHLGTPIPLRRRRKSA